MTIHRRQLNETQATQGIMKNTFKEQCQLILRGLNQGLIPKNKAPKGLKDSIIKFLHYDAFVNTKVDVVSNSQYTTVRELTAFRPSFTHSIYDEVRRSSMSDKNAMLLAYSFILLCRKFENVEKPFAYLFTYTQESADKGDLEEAIKYISDWFIKQRDFLKKSRFRNSENYEIPTANGLKAHFLGDIQGIENTTGDKGKEKMARCDSHALYHTHGHELNTFSQPLDLDTKVVLTRDDVPNMKEYRIVTNAATAFFFKKQCEARPDKTFALQGFNIRPVGSRSSQNGLSVSELAKGIAEVAKYSEKPDTFGDFDSLVRKAENGSNTFAKKQLQFKTEVFAECYNAFHGRTLHRSHGLLLAAHSFIQTLVKAKLINAGLAATPSNADAVVAPDLFTKHTRIDFDDSSAELNLEDLSDDAILYFNRAYLADAGLDVSILAGITVPKSAYTYTCIDGRKVNRSEMISYLLHDLTYQNKGKAGLVSRLDMYIDSLESKVADAQRILDSTDEDDRFRVVQSQRQLHRNQLKLDDVRRVKIAVVNKLNDSGALASGKMPNFDRQIKAMKLFETMSTLSDKFKVDLSKLPAMASSFSKDAGAFVERCRPVVKLLDEAFGSFLDDSLIQSNYVHLDNSLITAWGYYVRMTSEDKSRLLWGDSSLDRRTLSYNANQFYDNLPVSWFKNETDSSNYTDCKIQSSAHLQNILNKIFSRK